MFDLTTIQLMNQFADSATDYGLRPRDAINPAFLRAEEVGLIYGTCVNEQLPPEDVLDGMLSPVITHEQWENSQWLQCVQCGKLDRLHDSEESNHNTCSRKCDRVWLPF